MVINLKNPLPNLKGRKIIAIALAGIAVSGAGGYFLLAGGPPLNVNALGMSAPASILPANVPPPVVQPMGAEVVPVAQPGVASADQVPLAPAVTPVNAQVGAPMPVVPGAVSAPVAPVAPVAEVYAPPAQGVTPVAAQVVSPPAPGAVVVAPTVKPAVPPSNPIAAVKAEQQAQAPVKAPELGAKPAPVVATVSNAELMAKLDAMSRELRETRTAVANLQEKLHDAKKPQPVQSVPVRQSVRKAAPTVAEDHEASSGKAVSVQEIRPGARLPNGEVVSKITAEGAVTNTGRVIRWGEQ